MSVYPFLPGVAIPNFEISISFLEWPYSMRDGQSAGGLVFKIEQHTTKLLQSYISVNNFKNTNSSISLLSIELDNSFLEKKDAECHFTPP